MGSEAYPWRASKDFAEVLAEVRPVLISLGVVEDAGGCSEAEVVEAERRMGRGLPAEVRAFYRAVRPVELFSGEGRREFGFYPIGSRELAWQSMEGAEPAEDWVGASGLALGQSVFGDPFWWVEGHRRLPAGAIVLLDHGGALGEDVMFVHFARSYREFIAKIGYFGNLYPPVAGHELFRLEYLELNPEARG